MTDNDRSAHTAAKGIAGFVVAVIVINLLVRVIPFPDVDLSSIPFPDLPDWFGVVLKVKNAIIILIVLAVIVAAVVEDNRKKKAR
jgi:hypothetical protein